MASTMVRPPPPSGIPPSRRPPPPPGAPRPQPPRGKPSPPPPPPPPPRIVSGTKRSASVSMVPPLPLKSRKPSVSINAPVILRDVTAYQKKHQVGQGTYGSVFMGANKETGEIVALKRINTEQEENGFPITAIREVKILKALQHPNIVKLREIVTSNEQGENGETPKNVFMVFEYLEFDLTGILETPEIRLTQDHIKSWSQQLLQGVHYMHMNKIVHRDLKSSNLLVNRRGELKIADWGLARSWNSEMKRLTNRVITLWYRPPELLLGCMDYTTKIDMWSVGCIIAEMFRRSGFLKGGNEATQLDLIFRTCGHPIEEEWPDINKKCRLWKNVQPSNGEKPFPRRIREALKSQLPHPSWMTEHALDLIDNLMILNPDNRWSALEALDAEYFFQNPIVKPAHKLAMKFAVDSVHEWEARRKHEQLAAQRKGQIPAAAARRAMSAPSKNSVGDARPPPPRGPPPNGLPPGNGRFVPPRG